MSEKFICSNCNSDLLEVGVYEYAVFYYKKENNKITFKSESEGMPLKCIECDSEIDKNIENKLKKYKAVE